MFTLIIFFSTLGTTEITKEEVTTFQSFEVCQQVAEDMRDTGLDVNCIAGK